MARRAIAHEVRITKQAMTIRLIAIAVTVANAGLNHPALGHRFDATVTDHQVI